MSMLLTRCFLISFLTFCSFLSISQNIPIEKSPSWITPVEYPTEVADTVNSGGSYYLLHERQFNVALRETYARSSIKVLTENGLETASSINVNYEPSFQHLKFHHVLILRNGMRIDKLKNNHFEVIRREQNLERLMYDKSLDAYLNLDDVQVGDIVEYAYSIQGTNPVFENKFSKTVGLNFSIPVGRLYTDVACPSGRPLNYKVFNNAKAPNETLRGNVRHYTWDSTDVPAVLYEDRTPPWYDAYDYVEFSEYSDWKEIIQWALPMYPVNPSSFSPALKTKIDEIRKANSSPELRIGACIRFVQDEVRYLAFLDGVRGYKPNTPSLIFERRFGDCKDKSLLLSCMLTALGVKSYPALVNTSYGKVLNETLPSPTAFDHCITQYTFKDSTYWVDPTMTFQRGPIKDQYFPNYSNALVIAPLSARLVSIPESTVKSTTFVEEEYFLETVGTTAKLKVKSTYTGSDANTMRSYWKSTSAADIKKNYTDFYANEYASIRAEKNVEFVDDEFQNVLRSYEEYIIYPFWDYDSSAGKYTASFYARIIGNSLTQPSTKTRKMPLVISHPTVVDEKIIIHFPEDWTINEESKNIASNGFEYTFNTTYADRIGTMHWTYRSVTDYISAEDSKLHIRKTDEALGGLSHQIFYSTGKSQSSTSATTDFAPFLILLVIGVGIFLVVRKRSR